SVVVQPAAAGKVDDAAGVGFEPRGAAIAVVEEKRGAVVGGGDEGVAGGAVIEERHADRAGVHDSRIVGGSVVVEIQHAGVVVDDGGAASRALVQEMNLAIA